MSNKEEQTKSTVFPIYMPYDMRLRIRALAKKWGVNTSEVVRRCIYAVHGREVRCDLGDLEPEAKRLIKEAIDMAKEAMAKSKNK